MTRKDCCVCDKKGANKNIYSLKNIPIKLTCSEVPFGEMSSISFSMCDYCNTIQLDQLIPLEKLYFESHNYVSVGNIWKNYFNLFVNRAEPIVENKTVLEVGCPSGKIALKMNNYKKWFIVEPNKNESICFNEKVCFIEKFFDETLHLEEKVDVIIHSHLFEHIYEPNLFLRKCHELLNDDGEMFFGLPNMEVFEKTNLTPFFGLFFEHTVFLNKENIVYLLQKNRFSVIDIIDYESHSTLFHCKKSVEPLCFHIEHCIENKKESFLYNVNSFETFVRKCNTIISKRNKDVYIFGASYNTQFLLSFGLDSHRIKGILDNCKEKQGKYLYGYDIQIFDPTILSNNQDENDCNHSIVILKNGCYVDDVLHQIISINSNVEVIM